jgi:hypothetical protein
MPTVTSQDGTTIAFDKVGSGPAVILVNGAMAYRAFDPSMAHLANSLAHTSRSTTTTGAVVARAPTKSALPHENLPPSAFPTLFSPVLR